MRRGDGVTVALTGASGFVGAALLRVLLAQGYQVRALQHRTALPAHANLTAITGALNDASACAALAAGAQVVLHVGGLVLANHRRDFFRVNSEATEMLALAAANANAQKFLFVSSLAAREPQLSDYAASKHAAEKTLVSIRGLAFDILRPPAIYGPGDANSLPLLNMLRSGHVVLPVKPNSIVAMLYVEDLVAAIMAWLENERAPTSSIYEVGDKQGGYRWAELLAHASALRGKPVRLHPLPAPLALGFAALLQFWGRLTGKPHFVSPGKIREICHTDWSANPADFMEMSGWRAKVTFPQGLALTLDQTT